MTYIEHISRDTNPFTVQSRKIAGSNVVRDLIVRERNR